MDETNEPIWLIRDSSNRIRGPFRQAEVLQMIRKGSLKGKTEISRSNSYWFAIEEKNELARFFQEFNEGGQQSEAPTQMTATLNQADVQDSQLEMTQFVKSPEQNPATGGEAAGGADGTIVSGAKGEWLDPSYAEEFGDFGVTISVQTDVSKLNPQQGFDPVSAPATNTGNTAAIELALPTEERKREELLKRATVKADTLPSERHDYQGDRPKPISEVIRNGERPAGSAPLSSAVVSMPTTPEPAGRIIHEDGPQGSSGAKKGMLVAASLVVVALAGAGVWGTLHFDKVKSGIHPGPSTTRIPKQKVRASLDGLKRAILFFDLDTAKEMLSDLELQSDSKGQASFYLAQAIVKKEFLFDSEGAVQSLTTAKQLARDRHLEAEIDNLIAIYGIEHDVDGAVEQLKRISQAFPDEPVFRYNLAIATLRSGAPDKAISMLQPLEARLGADNPLTEDVAIGLGWAIESLCRDDKNFGSALCRDASASEDAFKKALDSNPNSDKAKIGLAIAHMRKGGIKSAESDLVSFLDGAPELDPPTRIINFSKIQDGEFYTFLHSRIADLNRSKPSFLVMAVDAEIAAIQSRGAEAAKILEPALSGDPGENNIMKVLGFLRWKEGQFSSLIEVLKDARGGFAVDLMLGKAFAKTGRRDEAEKRFRRLTESFPRRSEGFSQLGEIYFSAGRADEAKAQYLKAIQVDPLDLVAWRGLDRLGNDTKLTPELRRNLPF
jgi:predicted Zn-dependent protease